MGHDVTIVIVVQWTVCSGICMSRGIDIADDGGQCVSRRIVQPGGSEQLYCMSRGSVRRDSSIDKRVVQWWMCGGQLRLSVGVDVVEL